MEFKISKGAGGERAPALGAGQYEARLIRVVDLGMQQITGKFAKDDDGKQKPPERRINISFELPNETVEINGEMLPRIISRTIAVKFGERANMYPLLQAAGINPEAIGTTFKAEDLLGAPVILTVEQGTSQAGNTYAKITKMAAVSKTLAAAVPEAVSEMKVFSFDNPDMDMYESLPQFLQDDIKNALNFSGSKVEKAMFNQAEAVEPIADMDADDEVISW